MEHYSVNVVDTLHKKNLLLLGEDRYLTPLMLKDLSQAKEYVLPSSWLYQIHSAFSFPSAVDGISSTIHNLTELLLVHDLCSTFCFSMQFVVGMELAGTLILPATISFTLYLIILSAIR
jgi:chitin synthase